jgi:hypothetical protein
MRFFSNSKFKKAIPQDLKLFMHGRGNKERQDSVSLKILNDRAKHQERISSVFTTDELVNKLKKRGLGLKKKQKNIYSLIADKDVIDNKRTYTGAGMFFL